MAAIPAKEFVIIKYFKNESNVIKRSKRTGTLFLFTVMAIIATTIIRYTDVVIDVPISYTIFLAMAWIFSIRYHNARQVFVGLSVSLLVLEITGVIIDRSLPTTGAPNVTVSFLGIISGCVIGHKNVAIGLKLLLPVVISAFSIWYIERGYNKWFNFLEERSFSGNVNLPIQKEWYTISDLGDTLPAAYYQNKVILLDFWTTSCGVCFQKFPDLESLYQKYKGQPDLIIQAVNIPLERDTLGMAFYMISKYGKGKYTFPVVTGSEALRHTFDITSYPTIVLIKSNRVIFRGRIELVEQALQRALKK